MKSQVQVFFEKWLNLMDEAFDYMTPEQFQELEEKIKTEIAFHRKSQT